MTTTAVLQLVDRGLVALDDPAVVEKYAPELLKLDILKEYNDSGPVWAKRQNPITLKHLLSHSSGLAYSFTSPNVARWTEETGAPGPWGGTIEGFCEPLNFEPGTSWVYGIGIDWAGIIIERVTGQTLAEYFQENIFAPLGIENFTFYPSDHVRSHIQQVVGRNEDGSLKPVPSIRSLDTTPGQLSGGGGLIGTARGYLRFLQGVLASKTEGNGGLISPASFKTLFTNALPPRGPDNTCYQGIGTMTKRQDYHDPAHVTNGTAEGLEHSVGLLLNITDSVYGRKAGSGCWDGAAKTQYWVDPTTGVAGICFSQILAPNPDPFMKVYNAFERTLYDNLE